MIIVKISGGLGNQLFQYSFGKALAKKIGTKVKFDLQLDMDVPGFTPRSLSLEPLNLSLDFASSAEVERLKLFKSGIFSRLERKIAQKIPSLFNKTYVETPFVMMEDTFVKDNCYYDGYWQSARYFSNINLELKKELCVKPRLGEYAVQSLEQINMTNSVSLHIRRGDYLANKVNQVTYSHCDLNYYQNAVKEIRHRVETPVFYIFSDDIEWARANFSDESFRIMDVKDNQPISDFYLMSQCKHNIMANSSFSWWSSWLNSYERKVVVSPKNWYNDSRTNVLATKALIDENWILI